ncbi:MAG: BLUF domain-containing protein [Actinomycetota bacterium]
MQNDLWRLVYVSRNDTATDEDVEAILRTSRHRNASFGVTGALLFNSGCFAQVLEGGHDTVQRLYERIQLDERHTDVHLLDFDEIEERTFGHWSMGFVEEESEAAHRFAGIAASTGFDPSTLDGDLIFDLMYLHLAQSDAVDITDRSP